jgi:Arc/MetJ family transcription regulator
MLSIDKALSARTQIDIDEDFKRFALGVHIAIESCSA